MRSAIAMLTRIVHMSWPTDVDLAIEENELCAHYIEHLMAMGADTRWVRFARDVVMGYKHRMGKMVRNACMMSIFNHMVVRNTTDSNWRILLRSWGYIALYARNSRSV